MKSLLCSVIVTVIISSVTLAQKGLGPSPRAGQLVVPDSSRERPENLGVRAHTNHLIFKPATGKPVGGGVLKGKLRSRSARFTTCLRPVGAASSPSWTPTITRLLKAT